MERKHWNAGGARPHIVSVTTSKTHVSHKAYIRCNKACDCPCNLLQPFRTLWKTVLSMVRGFLRLCMCVELQDYSCSKSTNTTNSTNTFQNCSRIVMHQKNLFLSPTPSVQRALKRWGGKVLQISRSDQILALSYITDHAHRIIARLHAY